MYRVSRQLVLKVVVFPLNFRIKFFKVFSGFLNTTIILQFFRVILNFVQECYYLENKVGVVDFTKACGFVKFQSPQALAGPWAFAKSTTPALFLR